MVQLLGTGQVNMNENSKIGKGLWIIFSLFIIGISLYAALEQALKLGWYFLFMFLVSFIMYVRQGNFHKLIENPARIFVIFAVQAFIFSLGDLLIAIKESLLKGSLLTALILFGTYLYLRFEANRLKDL